VVSKLFLVRALLISVKTDTSQQIHKMKTLHIVAEFISCEYYVIVFNSDVVQRLSAAIVANAHTKLTSLDLSRNSIEDRGSIFLFHLLILT